MSTANVLIVDDEPTIRTTVEEALRLLKCSVTSAADGEEALRIVRQSIFDVVLLDLKLPGVDGMDVLRFLRLEQPETSVVIMTAHGSVDTAVEAMKLGAIDYLSKPFGLHEIRTAVQEAIDKSHVGISLEDDYSLNLEIARRALRRGEAGVARLYVNRALELAPNRPQAHNLVGVIAEVEGHLYAAQQAYRKALELDPKYAPASSNLLESVSPSTRDSFYLSEVKREHIGHR